MNTGALAAIRERLEWFEVYPGAYRVEGLLVMKSGSRWLVWKGETVGHLREFTPLHDAATLTAAMEWIAEQKENR